MPETTIKVGDRVRITAGPFRLRVGTVSAANVSYRLASDWRTPQSETTYDVTLDLCNTVVRDVARVERIYATGGLISPPKAEEPEVVLPMENLQAATFAHQLLGPDADLDKLIGVAEFAMDRRTLGTDTTGTVGVPPERFITGVAADGPSPSATVTPAVLPSTDDLVLTDRDGDQLTVGYYGSSDVLAKVYVRNARQGDQFAAYLTEADVDAVIARLQAFKAEGVSPDF